MTAVSFHFNAADPLHYACRLMRKAFRSGSRLMVTGPGPLLAELDRMLWTFEPLEFVPHWRGVSVAGLPARLWRTPIVLVDDLKAPPGEPVAFCVLLNLGLGVPVGFERFDRMIEVVGREPDDRQAARGRWRSYAGAGHGVQGHEVGA
jgi:DNA polymerase III subunit chi